MAKTTKKKRNSYNTFVVNGLSQKYSLTKQYIRQCLRGDRQGLTADRIRKEYKELDKKVQAIFSK